MNQNNLVFNIYDPYREDLQDLPWDTPLEEWDDSEIDFIDIRKGKSRHVIRFVKRENYSFAIKQTTPISAYFESDTFIKLLEIGIHTLVPAGYVIYKRRLFSDVKAKEEEESGDLAFMITVLADKSIPHSILFKWDFSEENRRQIYKSIAELLSFLHFKNVYWGDASLTNNLIKFIKEKDEKGRTRTTLKAFLADAETVKILPEISKDLLEEDIHYFFESLKKFNEEYSLSGLERGVISIDTDKKYFKEKYEHYYELYEKIADFENKTQLNVHEHFYQIRDKYAIDAIFKQIEEHKWYLSEKTSDEVSIEDAAKDWIVSIYQPIIDELDKSNISDFFPNTNSVNLYVQIMTHKYYMSIEEDKDVGTKRAIMNYIENYGEEKPTSILNVLISRIMKIFPANYNF